jgi:hypothetical protein
MANKLLKIVLMLIVIELCLLLFTAGTDPSDVISGTYKQNTTSLLEVIFNPQDWDQNPFINWILNNKILALAAGGIIVGVLGIAFKEFGWRAAVVGTLFTFSFVPIHLWLWINSWSLWDTPGVAIFMASITAGPILVYYIITLVDYISSPG